MARVSFPAPFKMVQTICRVSFAFWRGGASFLGFCPPDAFFFFYFFFLSGFYGAGYRNTGKVMPSAPAFT